MPTSPDERRNALQWIDLDAPIGIRRHAEIKASLALVWRFAPALGDVAGSVRVAGLEVDRVGVAGRDDDAAPVVEGVVEREDRRLLAAVCGGGGGERGRDLAGQTTLTPQRAGGVNELL